MDTPMELVTSKRLTSTEGRKTISVGRGMVTEWSRWLNGKLATLGLLAGANGGRLLRLLLEDSCVLDRLTHPSASDDTALDPLSLLLVAPMCAVSRADTSLPKHGVATSSSPFQSHSQGDEDIAAPNGS